MANDVFVKKPAFFRVMSAELFFEADASSEDFAVEDSTEIVDAELDEILTESR
ncbi:MAG TPA: hypothetical protein P5193_05885 [Microthrixaceae bacterium]|nr:hypothetical protein [Microthrixaceae bacterium]